MKIQTFLNVAGKQWIIVPFLLWYVLLLSPFLPLHPGPHFIIDFGNQETTAERSAFPASETDRQDTRSSSIPFHQSHSQAESLLCQTCTPSVLLAEATMSLQMYQLETLELQLTDHVLFVGAFRIRDDLMPDLTVPDPPFKIPIRLG